MRHYLYTKHTVSQRIGYVYRCSHCGKPLCGAISFQTSVNFDARSWTKKGAQKKADKAHYRAAEANHAFINSTIAKAMQGDYRQMNVDSRCSNCGHKEPWQCMGGYSIVKGLLLSIVLIILSVTFSPSLINKTVLKIFKCIMGLALIALLVIALLIFLHRRKMNRFSATLQKVSLHHFCSFNDKNSLAEALKEIGLRQNEEVLSVRQS